MKGLGTKYWIYLLKFFGWCLIIGISFFWTANTSSDTVDSFRVVMFLLNLIPLLLIYFINNVFFIPQLLFKNKRGWFLVANTIFLLVLFLLSYFYDDVKVAANFIEISERVKTRPRNTLDFIMRDLINNVLMIGFATALKLMGRLQASEEALKEAENARIKAELDNLRSQINPHFLLNTLNNIYALTEINPHQAQNTIKQLSLLLRYVLYDNLTETVPLIKEVEFLKNYIELMRIRLSSNVRLEVNCNIDTDDMTPIAPLIFISLIENAFKHGVSAQSKSFVEINIDNNTKQHEITLETRNSNYAKNQDDKSGKGIGLEQVKKRLELQYSGRYSWTIHKDKEQYSNKITLKTKA